MEYLHFSGKMIGLSSQRTFWILSLVPAFKNSHVFFFKSLPYLSFFTGFQTTAWRLISGVLGVICLLLMAALGVLLKNCKFL